MKGIIFNLLERVVRRRHGEDAWDDLLEAAGSDGVYTAIGSYPDEEFLRCIVAGAAASGTSRDAFLRGFARDAMPLLAASYPHFFEGHGGTRDFLETLNDVIHAEVCKLYPGADVPTFELEAEPDGDLALRYRSARKLCPFAEGLIEGAADHFQEDVRIAQPKCMLRGADHCLLVCSFHKRVGEG